MGGCKELETEVAATTRWCDMSRALAGSGMLELLVSRRYIISAWPGETDMATIAAFAKSRRVLKALVEHFNTRDHGFGGEGGVYVAAIAGVRLKFKLLEYGSTMRLCVAFA
jgi:hypothetical protein